MIHAMELNIREDASPMDQTLELKVTGSRDDIKHLKESIDASVNARMSVGT